MHYAIIAAGEGSRLQHEGINCPKPLVPIAGQPMLGRLIGLFDAMGAESISVICNQQASEVADYLSVLSRRISSLHYIVQSTPSSMHSLAALAPVIPEGKFCLTTVDTIFPDSFFHSFIQTSQASEVVDGLFAVTPFVDDEKPLWVAVQPESQAIIGFYDRAEDAPFGSCQLAVSGGIYCLNTRTAFPILRSCLKQGQSRMRNYQRALLEAGLCIKAYSFPKIMDIDHASDIVKAEEWLAEIAQ